MRSALGGLLVVLLLSACTGSSHKAAPGTTTASSGASTSKSSSSPDEWVADAPEPLTTLVAAGGHVVYLGVDATKQVELVGLDPTTGAVAWTRPSTLGHHITGVAESVVASGDTVFDVESSAGANTNVALPRQAAQLAVVAVDATNGSEVWQHPFAAVDTPLDKCGDALCVSSTTADGHLDITRLGFADGTQLSEGRATYDPIVAEDGEFAVSAGRDTDEVVLTKGFGQTAVWSHPRTELFGSPDITPNGGWAGTRVDGTWIAWLGVRGPHLGATIGLTDDGTRSWIRPDILPCPVVGDILSHDNAILCGRVDNAAQKFLIGTIEGIDPHTGQATWTVDAGNIDVTKPGFDVARFDDTTYGIHLASGDVRVDVRRGRAGDVTDRHGWCETVDEHVTLADGSRTVVDTTYAPCVLGSSPDSATPKTVPSFAGPTVAGYGVWVQDRKVRGAKSA